MYSQTNSLFEIYHYSKAWIDLNLFRQPLQIAPEEPLLCLWLCVHGLNLCFPNILWSLSRSLKALHSFFLLFGDRNRQSVKVSAEKSFKALISYDTNFLNHILHPWLDKLIKLGTKIKDLPREQSFIKSYFLSGQFQSMKTLHVFLCCKISTIWTFHWTWQTCLLDMMLSYQHAKLYKAGYK